MNGAIKKIDDIERIFIYKAPILARKEDFRLAKNGEIDTIFSSNITNHFIKHAPGYIKGRVNERKTNLETKSNKIFVVHGHDEGMKDAVARTLMELNLVPIILHEQPNQGRTIIEKFTEYAEGVSFAVVLLSPDDKGYRKDQNPITAKSRARQNVILELGFFIGKLGRNGVFPLFKNVPDFEHPSDFGGVLYTPFDNSGK